MFCIFVKIPSLFIPPTIVSAITPSEKVENKFAEATIVLPCSNIAHVNADELLYRALNCTEETCNICKFNFNMLVRVYHRFDGY